MYEVVPARSSARVALFGLAVATLGILSFALRFALGLGKTTGLSDTAPWGLWIVADLVLIALASGAFAVGAAAHVLSGERWHAAARPAVLLGLLTYSVVVVTLVADLGLPWHAWRVLVERPEHSAMFEVAWCVALYLVVLALELVPAVADRFGLAALREAWRGSVPFACVAALAAFTWLMSGSLAWAAAALAVFAGLAVLVRRREGSAERAAPVLLAVAALVLSTMHQSSLGSLFLLVPQKLDPLWWTPILPVEFLLSAVASGFATVALMEVLASKAWRRPLDSPLLGSLARAAAVFLALSLVVRLSDLAIRGPLISATSSPHAGLFLLEVVAGGLLPAAILGSRWRAKTGAVVAGSLLAVFGLVLHRLDTVLLAMDLTGPAPGYVPRGYVPSAVEIASTLSLVVTTVLLFSLLARSLPILARRPVSPVAPPRAG